MTEPTTRTLDVPGAVLTSNVRRNDLSKSPILFLIGSPMGAGGVVTLAGHFTDRTVVTYDPRGVERSKKSDDATQSTPDQHADDLHRLISELQAGPVEMFATSGGAVNALALGGQASGAGQDRRRARATGRQGAPRPRARAGRVRRRPRDVSARWSWSSDGEVHRARESQGSFYPAITPTGPPPTLPCSACRPKTTARGTIRSSGRTSSPSHYQFDFKALSAASTRIVIAAGTESAGELANRAAVAVAERLAKRHVTFPSNHAGFVGGEYGQQGDPDAFAATLRRVLTTKG